MGKRKPIKNNKGKRAKHKKQAKLSKTKQIEKEIRITLGNLVPADRRRFFGMSAKFLVLKNYRNAFAPITGFEPLSFELRHFHTGFNGVNGDIMNDHAIRGGHPMLDDCIKLTKADIRNDRPRALSKKMTRLYETAIKLLEQMRTPRPKRGARLFYRSLVALYIREEPLNHRRLIIS